MKSTVAAIILVAGILLFAGCASTSTSHYQTSRYYPDNATLRANIKTALWQDPSVAPFDLGVDVSRSTAHLTGVVDTPDQKRRAGEIALAVPGVSTVNNDIALRSPYVVSALGAPGRVEVGRVVEDPSVVLGRVIASPDGYYGKTLDLEGTVDTIFSPNSFTMYSAGMRDNPVLVVSRERELRGITPGDVVRVRGELEPFNRTAAAQRLNADLEPRKFDAWTSHAAVLADSVKRL